MCEVVSGHFYLPRSEGPTSKNTFYSTKNLALSDRIIFLKIQNVFFFEKFDGKPLQILSILKKNVFDIVIAT